MLGIAEVRLDPIVEAKRLFSVASEKALKARKIAKQ
jgi:hypothetical protein